MEEAILANQIITIYPYRHQRFRSLCLMAIFSLAILSLDAFIAWAFWTHFDIDTSAYVAAVISILATLGIGTFMWLGAISSPNLRPDHSLIMITLQGWHIDFWLHLGKIFLPWEEIEWIAIRRLGLYLYLSISLRDASRWWSVYGNGKSRKLRRNSSTGAQLNIPQISLCMPAEQILTLIEQRHAQELAHYHIQLLRS